MAEVTNAAAQLGELAAHTRMASSVLAHSPNGEVSMRSLGGDEPRTRR